MLNLKVSRHLAGKHALPYTFVYVLVYKTGTVDFTIALWWLSNSHPVDLDRLPALYVPEFEYWCYISIKTWPVAAGGTPS